MESVKYTKINTDNSIWIEKDLNTLFAVSIQYEYQTDSNNKPRSSFVFIHTQHAHTHTYKWRNSIFFLSLLISCRVHLFCTWCLPVSLFHLNTLATYMRASCFSVSFRTKQKKERQVGFCCFKSRTFLLHVLNRLLFSLIFSMACIAMVQCFISHVNTQKPLKKRQYQKIKWKKGIHIRCTYSQFYMEKRVKKRSNKFFLCSLPTVLDFAVASERVFPFPCLIVGWAKAYNTGKKMRRKRRRNGTKG